MVSCIIYLSVNCSCSALLALSTDTVPSCRDGQSTKVPPLAARLRVNGRTQVRLELGVDHLERVEVRRVGWQDNNQAPRCLSACAAIVEA